MRANRLTRTTGNLARIAVIWLAMLMPIAGAEANPGLETLVGSWSGSGRLNYTDGSSEGIRCNAYYTLNASTFTLAIQCRSEKNPIHIRSKLTVAGDRLSGDWEERTFNASGTASGSVSGDRIRLNVGGGGFTGSMSVSIGRSTHNVRIETKGIAMRQATIALRKSGR